MQAFHNKQEIKNKYLFRVRNHRKLDNIVQGQGWKNGKGCAVGCTLENYDHEQYEVELGIPEWLARVEDTIFEGLSREKALLWPEKFLSVIKPGVNLESVKKPFLIFILKQNLKYLSYAKYDKAKYPKVKKAVELTKKSIKLMIKYHETGAGLEEAYSVAYSAHSVADSAVVSADSVAYSTAAAAATARSIARSADSAAACSVAYSTAATAHSIARSAHSIAYSAALAADSVAHSGARSVDSTTRSAIYYKYACKLIQLLRDAK